MGELFRMLRRVARGGHSLSAGALQAMAADVFGWTDQDHAFDVYVQPGLPAAQARTLFDRFAVTTFNGGTREAPPDWRAAQLLRPEARPEDLTAEQVAAWPDEVAAKAAWLAKCRVLTLPVNVAVALAAHPSPPVQTHAAAVCPPDVAAGVVRQVGAAGAALWPGLSGPEEVSVLPERERLAWLSVAVVCGYGTPVDMRQVAALSWTSPACLSQIVLKGIGEAAANRIADVWMLPALASPDVDSLELVYKLATLCETVDAAHRKALVDAWVSSGRTVKFDDDDDEPVLRERLKKLGISLDGSVLTKPVRATSTFSFAEAQALVVEIEARAVSNPHVWPALHAVFRQRRSFDGTWGELLDAATVAAAEPRQ